MSQAFINYKPQVRALSPLNPADGRGGFDPATKGLVPLREVEALALYEALDTLTLAAEAGVLTQGGWHLQLFATREDFDAFIAALGAYDEQYRIHDRWWDALHQLAFGAWTEEEGFVSSEDIAQALTEAVRATGQAWPA